MTILFINQITGAAIIKAICWMLIHSLWQGLMLAIAGGAVVLLTKTSHPATRYNLLTTLFLFFVFTTAYTFTAQLHNPELTHAAVADNIADNFNQGDATFTSTNSNAFKPVLKNFSINFTYYFDKHAPLIVIAWFVVLSARLLKMMSGLLYINKIRNQQVHHPIAYWKNRTKELQSYLQINKRIRLLESRIIKVPMAVGWLKPIILIPMGLFTHLSEEQLEAILLHELAHIKRRDYFVNLLQSFAETIFFFNPAVLWISSLIRDERENCCDEMAIAVTKNKTKFINALVLFQEYNTAGYAMTFPGRKNQLLNRVQRIIYNTNNTLNSIEKAGILSCCLIIALLTAFTFPQHEKHNLPNKIFNIRDKPGVIAYATEKEATEPVNFNDKNSKASRKTFSPLKKVVASSKSSFLKGSVVRPASYLYNIRPVIQKNDTTPVIKTQLNIHHLKVDANIQIIFNESFKLNSVIKLDTSKSLSKLDIKLSPIIIKSPRFSTSYNYNYEVDSTYFKKSYKPGGSYKIKPYNPQPRAKPEPAVKPVPHKNPLSTPVIVKLKKNKGNFYSILNNQQLTVQDIRQVETLYQSFV